MELQRGRAYLTEKGRDLLAYCQQGAELHFTRAQIGDGKVETTGELLKLEKLIHPIKDVVIQGIRANGDGTSTISLLINNDKVETGFLLHELGLYANDPRYGEILYAICVYTNYPDFIPIDSQELTEILVDLHVVVANAENVTINIDRSMIYVKHEELSDLAGTGRTNQTVKGNWDLIKDLEMKLLMYTTASDNDVSANLFKIAYPFGEDEEWGWILDAKNGRLIV